MSMRCRHQRARYRVASIYLDGVLQEQKISQLTCEACGEVAPLGPANDEPEAVKVEIRAAEIAAHASRSPDGISAAWLQCIVSDCERDGYEANVYHVTECPAEDAGYLARCIAKHEEG